MYRSGMPVQGWPQSYLFGHPVPRLYDSQWWWRYGLTAPSFHALRRPRSINKSRLSKRRPRPLRSYSARYTQSHSARKYVRGVFKDRSFADLNFTRKPRPSEIQARTHMVRCVYLLSMNRRSLDNL